MRSGGGGAGGPLIICSGGSAPYVTFCICASVRILKERRKIILFLGHHHRLGFHYSMSQIFKGNFRKKKCVFVLFHPPTLVIGVFFFVFVFFNKDDWHRAARWIKSAFATYIIWNRNYQTVCLQMWQFIWSAVCSLWSVHSLEMTTVTVFRQQVGEFLKALFFGVQQNHLWRIDGKKLTRLIFFNNKDKDKSFVFRRSTSA